MQTFPLEIYNAYGGERIMVPISLRDSKGSLGFVKALLDTGAPETLIFENLLKRFRRLKAISYSPPRYSILAGYNIERKTVGELVICLRDNEGKLKEFKQEICAGINPNQQVASSNPLEMIIGLNFLLAHGAVLDFKNPAKPILCIEE